MSLSIWYSPYANRIARADFARFNYDLGEPVVIAMPRPSRSSGSGIKPGALYSYCFSPSLLKTLLLDDQNSDLVADLVIPVGDQDRLIESAP